MADVNDILGIIRRFKGQNFHMWQFQVRVLFLGKELMDGVDGTTPRPPLDGWIKKDSRVVPYFVSSCQRGDFKIYHELQDLRGNLEVHDQ
jgi:hypothetical protein